MSLSTVSPLHTPPRQIRPARKPLSELPLTQYILAANASPDKMSSKSPSATRTGVYPILKPIRSNSSQGSGSRKLAGSEEAKLSKATIPQTPPHHKTTPVNIRPHHPHVAATSLLAAPSAQPSPSTSVEKVKQLDITAQNDRGPATPQSPIKTANSALYASSDASDSQSDSSSSVSGATEVSALLQSLPRKRERVDDVAEMGRARERGQQPIISSPSPRKPASRSLVAGDKASHRRTSSSSSSIMMSPASALRRGNIALASTSPRSLHDDSVNDVSSDEDENEENDEDLPVRPLHLEQTGTPQRSSSDLFGASAFCDQGGLLVFQDTVDERYPVRDSDLHFSAEQAEDKENSEAVFQEFMAKRSKRSTDSPSSSSDSVKAHTTSRSKPLAAKASPSSSTGSTYSTRDALRRKKGTGGRLSLLATGEDIDGAA